MGTVYYSSDGGGDYFRNAMFRKSRGPASRARYGGWRASRAGLPTSPSDQPPVAALEGEDGGLHKQRGSNGDDGQHDGRRAAARGAPRAARTPSSTVVGGFLEDAELDELLTLAVERFVDPVLAPTRPDGEPGSCWSTAWPRGADRLWAHGPENTVAGLAPAPALAVTALPVRTARAMRVDFA